MLRVPGKDSLASTTEEVILSLVFGNRTFRKTSLILAYIVFFFFEILNN